MLINIINRAISLVWRITKLFLLLIMCGICFVIFIYMCVLIILYSGDDDNDN